MEIGFKGTLSKLKCKLQQSFVRISSYVRGFTAITKLGNEATESKKAFYVFSLMLLISLVFFAPDKIPQAFAHSQADAGILEKAQEIIKKLMLNLG